MSTQERTDLLTKINELELYISSSEKELRILISRKQVCSNRHVSLLQSNTPALPIRVQFCTSCLVFNYTLLVYFFQI